MIDEIETRTFSYFWKTVGISVSILIVSGVIISFIFIFLINSFYYGDYKIQKIWNGSEYNGQIYCNNCLWIEFYEGCNRYKTYYFENQQTDERLKVGMPVDIKFKGGFVQGVYPRKKYSNKC